MQSIQSMQSQDYQIWSGLNNEREIQIFKCAVYVRFFQGQNQSLSYLQYQHLSHDGFRKFQQIFLPVKYPIKLYKNLNEVILLQREQYFINLDQSQNPQRIYLKDFHQNLQINTQYILTKNNATNAVHSMLLQERLKGKKFYEQLQNFIKFPQCVSIPMDKQLHLNFQQQSDLNEQQNQAIKKGCRNYITFIKGPPGCGKTLTISRMIRIMASQSRKILIGSVSNIANAALVTKIIDQLDQWNRKCKSDSNKKCIHMIIHLSKEGLERFNVNIERFFINNQLCQLISEQKTLKQYSQKEIMELIGKVQYHKCDNNNFIQIYNKCYKQILDRTTVVLTTTINSLKFKGYTNYQPQIGIIDQAAQATIPDVYGFLSFGIKRLICVGDQKQLAPTVIGNAIRNNIIKKTIFELSTKNPDYVVQFIFQFRMHPEISQFANLYIYNNILKNAPITYLQRQSNIKFFKMNPTSFIQHNFEQQRQTIYGSVLNMNYNTGTIQNFVSDNGRPDFYNMYEGSLIMDFLIHVIPFDQWKNVAILTFYQRQMRQIQYGLRYYIQSHGIDFQSLKLTVTTVGGYQGGQKDYILISTVRSNSRFNNGQFFADPNRVNVGLTRARKGLIVFGNIQTLSLSKLKQQDLNIWSKFYQYNEQKGRIFQFQELKLCINNEKVKNAMNCFNNQINWVLYNLDNLVMKEETKQIVYEQIEQKNKLIKRQVKNLINVFRRIPQNNINNEQQRVFVYNFLREQKNNQSIKYYVEQNKEIRDIISEFALNHFSYNQIEVIYRLILSMHNQLNEIFLNDNELLIQPNLLIKCVQAVIGRLDIETQKIYNQCFNILCGLRSLTDKQYLNQTTSQKIQIKKLLIQLKVKFKCLTIFKQLSKLTFNPLQQ